MGYSYLSIATIFQLQKGVYKNMTKNIFNSQYLHRYP